MLLNQNPEEIIKQGGIKIKVKRAGMLQTLEFKTKKISIGKHHFTELFCDRLIDMNELLRIANELNLPIETLNGRAFPKNKSTKDFIEE